MVLLKDFLDSGVSYEIKVWIEDHGQMNRILSDVRTNAWYASRREGFVMPYPQLVLHRPHSRDTSGHARELAARVLRGHELLEFIPGEQLDHLVRESAVQMFANAEHIVRQGEAGASMFLLVKGEVEVLIDRDGHRTCVARLGSGDCFGEMSLLTGAPRTATVVAVGEVEAVEIDKTVFGALVSDNPEMLTNLSELLAKRQLANEQLTSEAPAQQVEAVRRGVLGKLREFFSL